MGATGAVGKVLVKELLENKTFDEVVTFGRRKVDDKDFNEEQKSKLKQEIIEDFGELPNNEEQRNMFTGFDAGFCCLGTTRKTAGSDEAFRRIDYQYVANIGEAAK